MTPARTRIVTATVRAGERVTILGNHYRPGSIVTVTETFTRTVRVRRGSSVTATTVTRAVVLATVRVPASGAVTVSVLPARGVRTGRLTIRAVDRTGRPVTLAGPIRVG